MKTSDLTGAELDMNNPIHTHILELDITVAGVTKTHELCVMYTYIPAMPVRRFNGFAMCPGLEISPPVPAQVEIHDIKVIVDFGGKETKTEYRVPMECKCLSPEHLEGIKERILEELE